MSKSRTPTQQLPLAIYDVPRKVRAHGLIEAHSWPLASRGKNRRGEFDPAYRRPAREAWERFASLELARSATADVAIVMDCDGDAGTERLIDWMIDRPEALQNWTTTRRSSGGSHAVWLLADPVLRGPQARQRPRRALALVSEYLAHALGADTGYRGILSHNPMSRPQGPDLSTKWGRRGAYTLAELLAVVPDDFKLPQVAITTAGRNWDFFRALLAWAGSPANVHTPAIDCARRMWAELPADLRTGPGANDPAPFSLKEAEGVAASVENYRQRWIRRGQFGLAGESERSVWGHRRGKASGRARRRRTRERDGAIVNGALTGQSTYELAAAHGVSQGRIVQILQRDVPVMVRPGRGRRTKRGQVHRSTAWRRKRRLDAQLAKLRGDVAN